MAEAHEIDNAGDKVLRHCVDDPGWPHARAYVDALAASRARVEHVVDVGTQCDLKSNVVHQPTYFAGLLIPRSSESGDAHSAFWKVIE